MPSAGQTRHVADGFKLESEHAEHCTQQHDPKAFVITADPPHVWNLDRLGRRNGSTMWWRFVCNDTRCTGRMLVRWDVLARFVTAAAPPELPAAPARGEDAA